MFPANVMKMLLPGQRKISLWHHEIMFATLHVTDADIDFVMAQGRLYVKLCINSMWIALLIHGFVQVKTWLLIACDIAFYAIIELKKYGLDKLHGKVTDMQLDVGNTSYPSNILGCSSYIFGCSSNILGCWGQNEERLLCQKLWNSVFEPPHDKTNKMIVRPAKTQISLIWVFAGHTCHFVGFVMRQLISCYLR